VRLGVKVDVHDLQVKARRAGQFLDHGDRVKVTVRFRGREISHANLGRDLLMRTAELLAEHGTVERQPLLEGRSMYIVMAPLEKRPEKKTDAEGEAGAKPNGETIGDAIAARAPAPPPEQPAATSEAPAQQGT
jgi:translation initiation factor IF-3